MPCKALWDWGSHRGLPIELLDVFVVAVEATEVTLRETPAIVVATMQVTFHSAAAVQNPTLLHLGEAGRSPVTATAGTIWSASSTVEERAPIPPPATSILMWSVSPGPGWSEGGNKERSTSHWQVRENGHLVAHSPQKSSECCHPWLAAQLGGSCFMQGGGS